MQPNLYIIASPNGAGKSLYSATLVKTDLEVFDGDKYISRLKQQFPEIGSDVLENRVNEHDFKKAKQKAIQLGANFAFETNFSSSDPTFSLREFRAAGYNAHLIFMGMGTVEECIQRVSIRVKSGGHKVTEPAILYNFEQGYANLYLHYKAFDTVTLLDNSIAENARTGASKSYYLAHDTIELYDPHPPEWIKKFIEIATVK